MFGLNWNILTLLIVYCGAVLLQQSMDQNARAANQPTPANQEREPEQSTTNQEPSSSMEMMAQSVTSMAEMCQMMMEQEMRTMPLRMAAAAFLGILLLLALILFVILEIQWIRFWNLRIKSERSKLGSS